MDPFVYSYARSVQESLVELPRELQLLATRVRESDVNVTNLLSELEGSSGQLKCSELITLSARLDQAYKSKFECIGNLVKLLDKKLAALERSKNDVISTLGGDSEGAVKEHTARIAPDNINSVPPAATPNNNASATVANRERRRRKPARHEVVRNRGMRQVQDSPTNATTDKPADSPHKSSPMAAPASADIGVEAVCICKQPPTGELVECYNEECSVGLYHLTCARLKSRPTGIWFCNRCIKRVK